MLNISEAIVPALATLDEAGINPRDTPAVIHFIQRRQAEEKNDAVTAFCCAVQANASVQPLLQGWIQMLGEGSRINKHILPSSLLRVASEGTDISAVEAELKMLASDGIAAPLATSLYAAPPRQRN